MLDCIKLKFGVKSPEVTIFPSYVTGNSTKTYFNTIVSRANVAKRELDPRPEEGSPAQLTFTCAQGQNYVVIEAKDVIETLKSWFDDKRIPFDMHMPLTVTRVKQPRRVVSTAPSASRSGAHAPAPSGDDREKNVQATAQWLHVTWEMKDKAFNGIRESLHGKFKGTLTRFRHLPQGAYFQKCHHTALAWLYRQVGLPSSTSMRRSPLSMLWVWWQPPSHASMLACMTAPRNERMASSGMHIAPQVLLSIARYHHTQVHISLQMADRKGNEGDAGLSDAEAKSFDFLGNLIRALQEFFDDVEESNLLCVNVLASPCMCMYVLSAQPRCQPSCICRNTSSSKFISNLNGEMLKNLNSLNVSGSRGVLAAKACIDRKVRPRVHGCNVVLLQPAGPLCACNVDAILLWFGLTVSNL